jgi:hypothetical protein
MTGTSKALLWLEVHINYGTMLEAAYFCLERLQVRLGLSKTGRVNKRLRMHSTGTSFEYGGFESKTGKRSLCSIFDKPEYEMHVFKIQQQRVKRTVSLIATAIFDSLDYESYNSNLSGNSVI